MTSKRTTFAARRPLGSMMKMRILFLLMLVSFLLLVGITNGQRNFECNNICQDGYEVTEWDGRVSLAWWTTLSCSEWYELARQGEFDETQCIALRELTFEPCGCTSTNTNTNAPPSSPPPSSSSPTTIQPTPNPTNVPTTKAPSLSPTYQPSPGPTPGPTTSRPTTSSPSTTSPSTSQPSFGQSSSYDGPTSEPSTTTFLPSASPTSSMQPTSPKYNCNICGDGNEITIWNGYIFDDFELTCLHLFLISENEGMDEEFCTQLQYQTSEACGCTAAVPSGTPTTISFEPTESPTPSPVERPTYWESYIAAANGESHTIPPSGAVGTRTLFLLRRSWSELISTTILISVVTMMIR